MPQRPTLNSSRPSTSTQRTTSHSTQLLAPTQLVPRAKDSSERNSKARPSTIQPSRPPLPLPSHRHLNRRTTPFPPDLAAHRTFPPDLDRINLDHCLPHPSPYVVSSTLQEYADSQRMCYRLWK